MRIKYLIVPSFSLLLTLAGFSQNATLTKGETLAYIQKKFREFEGTYVLMRDTTRRTISSSDKMLSGSYVSLIDDKITFSYSLSFRPYTVGGTGDCFCSYSVTFKPADIESMSYSNPYKSLQIILTRKTGRQTVRCCESYKKFEEDLTDRLVVSLNTSGDEDAINKIMKALNHLKELLKAEDDPFGN